MHHVKKKDLLMLLIAVSGELPADMPELIIGSESYAETVITRLKQEGNITVRNRAGCKGYILRARGKRYMLQNYEADVGYFLQGAIETNHIKTEVEKRIRLHRMSKAWVFHWRMGIPIFQSEKPKLFGGHMGEREGETMAYYGSLEFKGGVDAIKGSRACGILITGESVYIVYHTLSQRMKWAKKMERSMRSWTEKQNMRNGHICTADAIIIGDTMDFMNELLRSDGGVRKNLFQVDDVYERYYYLPMSECAVVQMRLLTNQAGGKALQRFLGGILSKIENREYAVHAGTDERGCPVYFCYELELHHLIRVKQDIGWKQQGSILCLDYQREALGKFFGEEVSYIEIASEKVMQYLRQEGR